MIDSYKASGNQAFTAGKADEAVAMFSMGLELDEANHVLWSNRSGAYAKQGKYALALTDAEKVLELKPDWVRGHSRKAAALEGLGRLEEALVLYNAALRMDPSGAAVKHSIELLTMKVEGKKAADADANDEKLQRAERLRVEGNAAMKAGDLDAAAAAYEEALGLQRIDERSATLHSNLSVVRLLQERFDDALTSAAAAVRLRPGWAKGHVRRGAALRALKRHGEALAAYKEALLIDTKNADEVQDIIRKIERERDFHQEFGGAAAAASAATPSVSAAPAPAPATSEDPAARAAELKEKGNAALKDGQPNDAAAFYTKALSYAPDSHVLLSNRSAARLTAGDAEAALEDATACLRAKPDFARGHARKAAAIERLSATGSSGGYNVARLRGAVKAYVDAAGLETEGSPQHTNYLDKAVELERIVEASDRAETERKAAAAAAEAEGHNALLGALVSVEDKASTQQVVIVEDADVLGDRKFDQGDYRGAIGYYTQAIKKEPSHPVNYTKRGICWIKVQRMQKALSDFDEVLRLTPTDAEAFLNKGNVLVTIAGNEKQTDPEKVSGRLSEAVKMFEEGKKAAQTGDKFDGVLAHVKNELMGWDQVKDDRIALNERLNAKAKVLIGG